MSLLNGIPLDGGCIEIQLAQASDVGGLLQSAGAAALGAVGLNGIIKQPPSRLTGVASLSFESSLDTQQPVGVGQLATRGYTPGQIKVGPGSMELWIIELAQWIEAYGGIVGFYNQQFDVTITYRPALGQAIQTIRLSGCRPTSVSTAHSFGTSDNLTSTITFGISTISYGTNGLMGAAVAVNNALRTFT